MHNESDAFLQKLCVLKGFLPKASTFLQGLLGKKRNISHDIFMKANVLKKILITIWHIKGILMKPIVCLE